MVAFLGNLVWVVFGGWLIALEYLIAGISLMLSIIGIPFGWQLIKIGWLSLFPFGNDYERIEAGHPTLRWLLNVIWFFSFGVWITLSHLFLSLVFCVTIIGIPFGVQHFKLSRVSLWPFGLAFESESGAP